MLTSGNIIPLLPRWREIESLVSQGRSILVHAPRFYGKRQFLRSIGENLTQKGDVIVINLSSNTLTPSKQLDFLTLWRTTVAQMAVKSRLAVVDGLSFETAFRAAMERTERRIHVSVSGCGRGNEASHNQLIGIFNNLLLENAMRQQASLSVMAIDDYSLFHYIAGRGPESDVAYFEKLHVSTLTIADICAAMRGVCDNEITTRQEIEVVAEIIAKITGGHVGLASELLSFSLSRDVKETHGDFQKVLYARAWASNIIEGLSASLSDDPESLSQTALEYQEPSSPEASNPRVHVLRELGILVRDWPSSKLRLCEGVITSLVRDVAKGRFNSLRRVGTIVSEFGPRVFKAENVEPEDDDFVVVLVSDLHCSDDEYRFCIDYKGGPINPGKPSLVQLLKEDLTKLDLIGRIDVLVIGGDVAAHGKAEEYDRAEAIIAELIAVLGLDIGRVVLIPGNHDLDWTPGKIAVTEQNRAVSKDGYFRFLRLVGKASKEGIDAARIVSRSGKKALCVIGFDSNAVEGPGAGGIGYVANSAFEAAERHMMLSKASDGLETVFWLAVHHHVFPATSAGIQEAEKKKVSVLANSSELQARAIKWSAEVIMHGHEHQPSVTVARTWPVDEGQDFAPLIVVGAGSVSAQRELLGEFSRNQYFVLYRRERDIIIRSRCMGDHGTGFIPHNDLIIPLAAGSSKVPEEAPSI